MTEQKFVEKTSNVAADHGRVELQRAEPEQKGGLYSNAFNLVVLVAGLGYLIDTYDFFLYNGMRVVSLTELGLSGDVLTKTGIIILNCQIFGALIGSFVWGILGDKIGRKRALLGSILLYSLGMIATGLVQDPVTYGIVRFITGFGVAGEVGLGATLVAETVAPSKRTYALMFFTVMGVFGVVIAGISIEVISWRMSCFIGGLVGLLLLTLRSLLLESKLFLDIANKDHVLRGSLRALFGQKYNLKKYVLCIPLLGANFLVTGVLLTLAPEVANATGVNMVIKANIALAIYFLVAMLGDWFGAWLSDKVKSRKIVAAIFILANACLAFLFLYKLNLSGYLFYFLCAAFGLFNVWAITATIVVEQFPTNLRATATTSNMNFSRATVILMNIAFLLLKPIGITSALAMISVMVFAIAFFCIWQLPETYGRSLTE